METAAGFDTESSTTQGGRLTHLYGIDQIVNCDHGNSTLPALIPTKGAIEPVVPVMSNDLAREEMCIDAIAPGPRTLYNFSKGQSQRVGSPALAP